MSIKQQINAIPNKWREVILTYPNIEELCQKVESMYNECQQQNSEDEVVLQIFPQKENIFRCFYYQPPEEIKVVMIGQDPYHGGGQATGLCFGVNPDCKIPPSLRNINKELVSDIGHGITDSTLENWAKQGVLLINSALTVREHCPASHAKIWKPFTEYILTYLNQHTENKIFIAWGAFAYNCLYNKKHTLNTEKHALIVSSHPSPLSALKMFKTYPKFMDSKPFTAINKILRQQLQRPEILW
tara:strand:- start:464 stop:1192 length:729 start_codon:yes stop_codon:yes gene_type:complete